MPAAAVIRRVQALSGFIGRKEYVGGLESWILKPRAQPGFWIQYFLALRIAGASGIGGVAVKCVDLAKNTNSEGSLLGYH